MPLTEERIAEAVLEQLTAAERNGSVVYILSAPISAGATFDVPHVSLPAPWEAVLAFVDQAPTANWGHACRYVFINRETGEALSFDARYPPSAGNDSGHRWQVLYRAASVPDFAVVIPR